MPVIIRMSRFWMVSRQVGSAVTDGDGYASQTVEHGYHYDKTFQTGHPAPAFVPVPEEEEDEEEEVINEMRLRRRR